MLFHICENHQEIPVLTIISDVWGKPVCKGVWLRATRGAYLKGQSGKRRRIPAAEKKASNRSLGQTTSEKWGEKNSCFLPAPYCICRKQLIISENSLHSAVCVVLGGVIENQSQRRYYGDFIWSPEPQKTMPDEILKLPQARSLPFVFSTINP